MTVPRLAPTLALALIALAPVRAQKPEGPSLAARVQRFEDTEEIRTVLLNYGRHLDSRDFGAYSRLFAKDGEWVGGFGSVKGPAAIQAFMEKNIPGPNKNNTFHVMSSIIIEITGDKATAWSRWSFVVAAPDNKPVIAQAGHYDDTLIRENGHWRFLRRTASNDIPAPQPAPAK